MNQHEQWGRGDDRTGPQQGDNYRGGDPAGLAGPQGGNAWGQIPHAPLEGPQGRHVDLQREMAAAAQGSPSPGGAGTAGSALGGWGHVPEAPHGHAQADEEFEPEYRRWREEQLRALDEDYRAWRQDRYRQFADEFSQWRSRRAVQPDEPTGHSG